MTINYSDKVTPPENSPTTNIDIEVSDFIDQELISKLDSIKNSSNLYKKYSEIYSGGVYALNEKNRTENPDWMSQSANSFREIFYVLQKNETKTLKKILEEYLKKSLTKKEIEKYKEYLNNLYGLFSDLTHHFSGVTNLDEQVYIINESLIIKASELDQDQYFKAVKLYKQYLKLLVITAIEIHRKIDEYINENKKDKELVKVFLTNSYDSKIYFFSKANEKLLHWLWTNGFLVSLKKPAEDSRKYSYRMPELEYLIRMAEKDPAKVAQIINSVKISEANFNPEVIDRFLWIIDALPTEQVKLLTSKIKNEKWVYLMRGFRKTGYEFDKIIKKLIEKKENNAILELAQAILSVKNKSEMLEKGSSFNGDDPFYVSDLDASGIFTALVNIEESYVEQALQIATGTMTEIIKLAEPDDTRIFDFADLLPLYDVDFFTLEIEQQMGPSYREDVKNLAATIKILVEKTISKKCGDVNEVKRLFTYINQIPLSRSMWRLRLFTLAQCPKTFREDLKLSFFKVFDVGERYFEVEGGAEYHQALIRGFGVLDPKTEQREYIKKVFEYFDANLEDEDKKQWRKREGAKILSFIKEHLTPEEKAEAKERFGISPDEVKFVPEPTIGKMQSGSVSHRSHVNLEDFTIEQIVTNLKTEWTQEKLNEQFKNDDFLNPRGVEGLGDALKEDIQKRTDEYLKDINTFFDSKATHSHYMYSLLRGIEEMFRNKQPFNSQQIGQIFGLFETIKNEGEKTPFKKKNDKSWLADWIEVHRVIADILCYVLENKEIKEEIHRAHREQIKNLISYLFTIKDSPSKNDEKSEHNEPHHVAINSVRGRAYEAFVAFTEIDGKELAADIKEVYKQSLYEDSLAVRFLIGRYLASFYFRDKEFITDLLPEIFPKEDSGKKDIYLASWEGYLSNTLYDKLFVVLNNYYRHAITLDSKDYTQRKYLNGLDESLAVHLSLAFAHLGLEMSDQLFIQFWSKPNIARYHEFISFIGRSCLTRDNASDEWLNENKVSKEKLIIFWDWALENVSEPEALAGFGFWINPGKEILDDSVVVDKIAQTLKKSAGKIDRDYGLLKRLPIFAAKNGDKTLAIISRFLLDSDNNLNQNRRAPLLYEEETKEALKIIYENGDKQIKQKVVDFVNILIEKGSNMFWGLKEVISESSKEI